MAKIYNTKVYGLERSIVRSGYPMLPEDPTELGHDEQVAARDYSRAIKLANTPIGEGHDNFLQGIIVQADFQMPSYWWPEAQRYHWFDFVSSQSKMHRLLKFDLDKQCIEGTDQRAIDITKEYIQKYNESPTNDNFELILKNTPMGLELTAGMTTNYRQLKTMYSQRKNHRLSMWTEVFCPWVEGLPFVYELGVR